MEIKQIGKFGDKTFNEGDILKITTNRGKYHIGLFDGFDETWMMHHKVIMLRNTDDINEDGSRKHFKLYHIIHIEIIKNADKK